MVSAAIPANEAQRLEALYAYHAFRTGPEPGFDRITSLVSRTLGISSAYVSLVGDDTQWLKSCFNLPGPRETSRDIAFCAHAILSDDVFVVPDATLDPRFADSPLVLGPPYVRFYAGCPLRTPSGYCIGTLCAVDSVPRVPTAEMLAALKDLAAMVVDQLELRKWVIEEEVRQKKNAETSYRRLAEAIHGMVFRTRMSQDGEYEYLYVSPGSVDLIGLDEESFRNDRYAFLDRIHLDDLATYNASLDETLARSSSWSWTGRITTTKGKVKWVQGDGRFEKKADGSVLLEGLISDISDTKARESALNDAKEAAEHANQAKSEFLSRMSHELRTPMNAILGFTQMLELEPLAEEAREDLSQVRQAGEHLLGLINEVLDLSVVDANRVKLTIEPVRLDHIMSETVGLLRPLFEAKGVRLRGLSSTVNTALLGDRQRVKQVFINLITNAVKYNCPGGDVSVSVSLDEDGMLSVGITDGGLGIDSEKLDRLFTPFDRLGAEGSGVEGTGLGLAISRGLIHAMNGELLVRSVVGEGSTFTVRLPSVVSSTAPLSLPEEAPEIAKPRDGARQVLYIEDNQLNVQLLRRILRQRPEIHLSVAETLAAGIAVLEVSSPDVLLLDLNLPDGSGESIVRWVRNESSNRSLPIIVLTADATPGQADRLLSAGADYFLTKPLDMKLFLKVLDSVHMEVAA